MTSVATPLPDLYPGQRHPAGLKFALALGLVVLADFLFYDQRAGLSVVVFAVALTCGSLTSNFGGVDRRRAILGAVIFLAGLVPALEELNPISFAFLIVALGCGIAILTDPNLKKLGDWLVALRDLLLVGPFRTIADATGLLNLAKLSAGLALWFVPLALGGLFVFLFASANPLIEKWLAMLNPGSATSHVDIVRVLFWAAALLMVWPFIKLRWRRQIAIDPATLDLDAMALDSNGPQALPAIDKARQLLPSNQCLVRSHDRLVQQQQQIMASWRSWGFRSYRLQRTLDQRARHFPGGERGTICRRTS